MLDLYVWRIHLCSVYDVDLHGSSNGPGKADFGSCMSNQVVRIMFTGGGGCYDSCF